MVESDSFVEDGYERARHANEPQIRERVESEFASQLEGKTWFQRRKIRKLIEAEITRRCDELAPPDALY